MSPGSTKILHLSDIHFGRIDAPVLDALKTFIEGQKNELDLIIVTGDLTQRAKKNEFAEARVFLENLGRPVMLVPGNHDVPLYNIFLRFFAPYLKFQRYLGSFSQTFYEDDRVVVYGLWSTNNFTIKDGRITEKDLIDLEKKFSTVPSHKTRIIASHHGIFSRNEPMKGDTVKVLAFQPHILLSGHEHQSGVSQLPEQKFPLIVASGTSTSNRRRVEANSFNVLTIASPESMRVETFVWEGNAFNQQSQFKI